MTELTPWDKVQIARHPQRPHSLDYIRLLCDDFFEFHGDRRQADDPAIICGVGSFEGQSAVLIGHQKGSDTKENLRRNFGLPHPEGYRKALRMMRHAEKFGLPVIALIDTPGASPSIEAEKRGQAQAIAQNLVVMADLRVPIIAAVIGEGGSGGALAIGVADRLLMLEHSVYSVASPEASAAILWRDSSKASEAAKAMKITAQDLLSFGIIDEVVPEPEGGAHLAPAEVLRALNAAILRHLNDLQTLQMERLLEQRYTKYRVMGRFRSVQEMVVNS